MSIDRSKILDTMPKAQRLGDENGLMPAFNVLLNMMPGKFWSSFAERLTRQVPSEMLETAEFLLVNAAHECGYHTGHGIITSDEWNAVVGPMVEKEPEDILYGAFAVLTAWGWAKSEIVELAPGERMVVRAYDYYESDVVGYGASSKASAYMVRGISAAFMDLAYGGPYDVTGKTGLRTFQCRQVKGVECGDEYGEFVVTRA